MERYFAFSSGGAYQFQGFGEWKIRTDDRGLMTVEHNLFGTVTGFGPYQLSSAEAASLWELIAAAAFEQRLSSRKRGLPDEAVLGFALSAQETLHSFQLWASEAARDAEIAKLLTEIGGLIQKYTGRKPVLLHLTQ